MNNSLSHEKRIYATEIVIKSVVLAKNEHDAIQQTLKNLFQIVPLDSVLSFELKEKVTLATYEELHDITEQSSPNEEGEAFLENGS